MRDTTPIRRRLLLALAVSSSPVRFASAQSQGRMVRLGVLTPDPRDPDTSTWKTFAAELARLGWTEGRNLRVERRFVDMGRLDVLDRMARDLVDARVDVIYAAGGSATALAAKRATATVPIVFHSSADPVGMGLVSSLAHPGTNLTGSSIQSLDLFTKQFQLLRRVSRKLTSIAYIESADRKESALAAAPEAAASAAAKALGIRIQFDYVSSVDQVEAALQRQLQGGVDGIVISGGASFPDPVLEKIAALLVAYRLPSLGAATEGFLLDYGVSDDALARVAARDVDKILRGAKPADLPVELGSVFGFVLNLATAKALGLDIPPDILIQATEVIR